MTEPTTDELPPTNEWVELLTALLSSYTLILSQNDEVLALPLDPQAPRVGRPLSDLRGEIAERAYTDYGKSLYSQAGVAYLDNFLKLRAGLFAVKADPTNVGLRVVQVPDPTDPRVPQLFIDIGDKRIGYFIHVRAGSWRLVDPTNPQDSDDYPVAERPIFTRPDADFAKLPMPAEPDFKRGTGRDWLKQAMNLREQDWLLVYAWLMTAYFTDWHRLGLMFAATSMSGKSIRTNAILKFIQPNSLGGGFPGAEERAWATHGRANAVFAFDDIAAITEADHANLKRAATGFTVKQRRLYSDTGLVTTHILRPVIITANGEPRGLKDDLRNRLWIISLENPPYGEDLMLTLDRMAPRVFADLLDDMADALSFYGAELRDVDARLNQGERIRPREATAFLQALDHVFGYISSDPVLSFTGAAATNRRESLETASEGDNLVYTIRGFLSEFTRFHPNAPRELPSHVALAGLADVARAIYGEHAPREEWVPKSTQRLTAQVSQKNDALMAAGIRLTVRKHKQASYWFWDEIAPDDLLDDYRLGDATPVELHVINTPGNPLAGPTI